MYITYVPGSKLKLIQKISKYLLLREEAMAPSGAQGKNMAAAFSDAINYINYGTGLLTNDPCGVAVLPRRYFTSTCANHLPVYIFKKKMKKN